MKDKLYYVSEDLQGGTFGTDRLYTIEMWRQQAIVWADSDDNEEYIEILEKLKQEEVINFISVEWQLEFKEISTIEELNIYIYWERG